MGRCAGSVWALCLVVAMAGACGGDTKAPTEQEDDDSNVGEPQGDDDEGDDAAASPGDDDDDDDGDDDVEARPDARSPMPARDANTPASGNKDAGTPGASSEAGAPSANDSGAPNPMPGPTGPADGDPAKPMVSIPGIKCGAPTGRGVPPTIQIGGRDVVVTYPCAHEGAQVTFLFVLHGTLQEAQKFSFTLNAGPYHRLSDSHNVIYVLPKAIGTQWGRMDNGADLPHLYEVIDWVYKTFGEKFNIRSMWAQGGSWGAAYLRTFACDAKLEQRLKGVRMVVGPGCPPCTTRLSCIVAQQELEVGGGMMMSAEQREMAVDRAGIAQFATSKGCQAKMGPMPVGTTQYWNFPGCQKGWVYSYYLGPGQHADPWDMASVTKSMEEMKSIE
jgi:hypothetical protein